MFIFWIYKVTNTSFFSYKKFDQFLFHATKILYSYALYIYNILHITLFFDQLYLIKNFLLKIKIFC